MLGFLPRQRWFVLVLPILLFALCFASCVPVGAPQAVSTLALHPATIPPQETLSAPSIALNAKIDPLLQKRLQKTAVSEALSVAIWVASDLPAAQERAWDELSARYPEVAAIRGRESLPFMLSDSELSNQVMYEYNQILERELQRDRAPVVAALRSEGIEVKEDILIPSISADLTPAQIADIVKMREVLTVFDLGGVIEPAALLPPPPTLVPGEAVPFTSLWQGEVNNNCDTWTEKVSLATTEEEYADIVALVTGDYLLYASFPSWESLGLGADEALINVYLGCTGGCTRDVVTRSIVKTGEHALSIYAEYGNMGLDKVCPADSPSVVQLIRIPWDGTPASETQISLVLYPVYR